MIPWEHGELPGYKFNMPEPLIFITKLPAQGPVILDSQAEHHLRVRRELQDNNPVILSDGELYCKAILKIEKKKTLAVYNNTQICPAHTSFLHLHIAVIKPEPLAWAVQKATEMGVASIQLIMAKRSQQPYWSAKSYEHLQKIINSACEQSRQYRPPVLLEPCTISELSFSNQKNWLYADLPQESISPPAPTIEAIKPIAYLIGPEGGWDGSEKDLLSQKAQCLTLPGPILRAETAAIACTSLLLWGNNSNIFTQTS